MSMTMARLQKLAVLLVVKTWRPAGLLLGQERGQGGDRTYQQCRTVSILPACLPHATTLVMPVVKCSIRKVMR
jgi:hypothetical protein